MHAHSSSSLPPPYRALLPPRVSLKFTFLCGVSTRYSLPLISLPASLCLFLWSTVTGLGRCRIHFRASELQKNALGKETRSAYQRHISLWVVNFLFRQPFSSPEAQLKLASCGLGKPPGSRAPTGTSSLTFSSLEPPVPMPPLFAHLLFMFPSQGVLGHYVLTPGE